MGTTYLKNVRSIEPCGAMHVKNMPCGAKCVALCQGGHFVSTRPELFQPKRFPSLWDRRINRKLSQDETHRKPQKSCVHGAPIIPFMLVFL